MVTTIRRNWLFVGILAVGIVIRLLTMIAYPPALFFGDSWGYLSSALTGHFVSLSSLRPVGYSFLIRLVTFPGRGIGRLIALQHLAGLVMGVLVYLSLVRAQIPRVAAALAAALILLDGYAVTLEQYVMADTFYALTVLVAILVLLWPRLQRGGVPITGRRGLWLTALSGLLLGFSAIERQVGLWAVPTLMLYLIWTRTPRIQMAAFLLALVVPLTAYASAVKADFGVFGLSATSGRTLYGRVAGFANCQGVTLMAAERALCETPAQQASHPTAPDWYLFAATSPAQRHDNAASETIAQQARANTILGHFAKKIILHQPMIYARSVLADFFDFFRPGVTAYRDAVSATSLPLAARDESVDNAVRRQVLPSVHPQVRAPFALVRAYRRMVHVPRPVLAVLALVSLLCLIIRSAGRQEILLTAGTGLMLLLGTSATGGFGLRYLLPAVPLLAIGGGLAMRDLAAIAARSPRLRRPWPRPADLDAVAFPQSDR